MQSARDPRGKGASHRQRLVRLGSAAVVWVAADPLAKRFDRLLRIVCSRFSGKPQGVREAALFDVQVIPEVILRPGC